MARKKKIAKRARKPPVPDPEAELDVGATLNRKIRKLCTVLKDSKRTVIYTGAGISTAANIPDYRSANGLYKYHNVDLKSIEFVNLRDPYPTYTHMAIKELVKEKYVHHVASQNCDGLHLRSGLSQTKISELHGNVFIEICTECGKEKQYLRDFDCTTFSEDKEKCHITERRCLDCGNFLKDTIVFGGELARSDIVNNWKGILSLMSKVEVIICIGTSLTILKRYKALFPPEAEVIIINLQKTAMDDRASLIIRAKSDDVFGKIMETLKLEPDEYCRKCDPILSTSSPNYSIMARKKLPMSSCRCRKENDESDDGEREDSQEEEQQQDEDQQFVSDCMRALEGGIQLNGESICQNGSVQTPVFSPPFVNLRRRRRVNYAESSDEPGPSKRRRSPPKKRRRSSKRSRDARRSNSPVPSSSSRESMERAEKCAAARSSRSNGRMTPINEGSASSGNEGEFQESNFLRIMAEIQRARPEPVMSESEHESEDGNDPSYRAPSHHRRLHLPKREKSSELMPPLKRRESRRINLPRSAFEEVKAELPSSNPIVKEEGQAKAGEEPSEKDEDANPIEDKNERIEEDRSNADDLQEPAELEEEKNCDQLKESEPPGEVDTIETSPEKAEIKDEIMPENEPIADEISEDIHEEMVVDEETTNDDVVKNPEEEEKAGDQETSEGASESIDTKPRDDPPLLEMQQLSLKKKMLHRYEKQQEESEGRAPVSNSPVAATEPSPPLVVSSPLSALLPSPPSIVMPSPPPGLMPSNMPQLLSSPFSTASTAVQASSPPLPPNQMSPMQMAFMNALRISPPIAPTTPAFMTMYSPPLAASVHPSPPPLFARDQLAFPQTMHLPIRVGIPPAAPVDLSVRRDLLVSPGNHCWIGFPGGLPPPHQTTTMMLSPAGHGTFPNGNPYVTGTINGASFPQGVHPLLQAAAQFHAKMPPP